MRDAERHPGAGRNQDRPQNRAGYTAALQHDSRAEADQCDQGAGPREIAEREGIGLRVGDHHPGVTEAEHRDKQTDRCAEAELDLCWNEPHHEAARAHQGQDQEQHAGDERNAEARLPRDVFAGKRNAENYRAANAGPHQKRQIRVQRH